MTNRKAKVNSKDVFNALMELSSCDIRYKNGMPAVYHTASFIIDKIKYSTGRDVRIAKIEELLDSYVRDDLIYVIHLHTKHGMGRRFIIGYAPNFSRIDEIRKILSGKYMLEELL